MTVVSKIRRLKTNITIEAVAVVAITTMKRA